jgi:ABC-type branched-subunit amino acid transport system ATPase component
MRRDFEVGDIVVRNGRGFHHRMKNGTRWKVVKVFNNASHFKKMIIVQNILSGDGHIYEEYIAPAMYFDLSARNYHNASKYGNNYRQKVAT